MKEHTEASNFSNWTCPKIVHYKIVHYETPSFEDNFLPQNDYISLETEFDDAQRTKTKRKTPNVRSTFNFNDVSKTYVWRLIAH